MYSHSSASFAVSLTLGVGKGVAKLIALVSGALVTGLVSTGGLRPAVPDCRVDGTLMTLSCICSAKSMRMNNRRKRRIKKGGEVGVDIAVVIVMGGGGFEEGARVGREGGYDELTRSVG